MLVVLSTEILIYDFDNLKKEPKIITLQDIDYSISKVPDGLHIVTADDESIDVIVSNCVVNVSMYPTR